MENISQMSMLEVACMLMEKKRTSQPIKKLIKEVLEIKGIDDPTGDISAQLYVDITTSSKFVYMGNEEWDLKIRQSLDEWDKDGSAFNENVEEDDDDEDLTVDDYILSDDDEDSTEDEDEDIKSYEEDEEDEVISDDEEDEELIDDVEEDIIPLEDEENFMDEETYGEYMDDYEDLYDEE